MDSQKYNTWPLRRQKVPWEKVHQNKESDAGVGKEQTDLQSKS